MLVPYYVQEVHAFFHASSCGNVDNGFSSTLSGNQLLLFSPDSLIFPRVFPAWSRRGNVDNGFTLSFGLF
jgi:hypothetical protein